MKSVLKQMDEVLIESKNIRISNSGW